MAKEKGKHITVTHTFDNVLDLLKNTSEFQEANFMIDEFKSLALSVINSLAYTANGLRIFYSSHQFGSEVVEHYLKTCFVITEFFKTTFRTIQYEPEITVLLLDIPKIAPRKKNLATKEHVNSGVCFSSRRFSKILIWRKEELLKVLIHELTHAYKLDHFIEVSDLTLLFNRFFVISTDSVSAPREALTELYTNLLLAFLISCDNNKNIWDIINRQLEWSYNRMRFVLSNIQRENNVFVQETDVLSYYVVKTMFLYTVTKNRYMLESILLNKETHLPRIVQKRDFWEEFCNIPDDNSNNRTLRMIPSDILADSMFADFA